MTSRKTRDPLQGKSFRELFVRPDAPVSQLESRRRFVKAGLAAAPVLMTVTSRPVWGTDCSFSGDIMSGNASQDTHSCSVGVGCTHGFWKNALDAWALLPLPDDYSYGTCINTNNGGKCTVVDGSSGTKFWEVFGDDADIQNNNGRSLSLYEVLELQGDYALQRDVVAAVLNSLAYTGFGATKDEIVHAYRRAIVFEPKEIDPDNLADVLSFMNNRGCPLSNAGDCQNIEYVYLSPESQPDEPGDTGDPDLCNVPARVVGGECTAVITDDMFDDPLYQCNVI